MQTQVAIIGGGPAGLMLAQLLHLKGIDSVVLESREAKYVIDRVRAGVIEQFTTDLMVGMGVGAGLQTRGMFHDSVYLSFGGKRHLVPLAELTGGKGIHIYGQNEIVKDLMQARMETGRLLLYGVSNVSVHGIDSDRPKVCYEHDGERHELKCDFIAGCDGFHGICRPALADSILGKLVKVYDRTYPLGWLGILAEAPPSSESLVYTCHERGFALLSMRSPKITRLYLQVQPHEDIRNWSDDAIWGELLKRMTTCDGWQPNVGPILNKGVTAMRSFVTEPMNAGRLYLAGDAAHIVPPTGAKGLNLAAADVMLLGQAIARFYCKGATDLLESYSETALKRVWSVQRFSWWMTQTMHRFPDACSFDNRRQIADLEYITSSKAALTSLAENYVGLPMDITI